MKSKALLFLATLIFPNLLFASYLRLVPTVTITVVDGAPGAARIAGKIENQGDEVANDVKIESAHGGKILFDLGPMAAGEEKDVSVDLPEKELGIDKDGYYLVPLHVLYKDANKVSFSAAFILNYTKKSDSGILGRSSPVSIAFDETTRKTGSVDVNNSGEMEIKLSNTGTTPVDVSLEFVGSKELEFKTGDSKIKLDPQQEKTLDVKIKNVNALAGSSYASYAMVSGLVDGQTFSDYVGFVVKVGNATSIPWLTYIFGVVAVGFVVAGFVFWKKGSKEAEATPQ